MIKKLSDFTLKEIREVCKDCKGCLNCPFVFNRNSTFGNCILTVLGDTMMFVCNDIPIAKMLEREIEVKTNAD